MTTTQYLLGWLVYLVGATGCMIVLWRITHRLPTRLKRVLLLVMATILYIPWYTRSDMNYFAPALLTALYDGLSNGKDAIARSGLVIGIVAPIAVITGLILPVKKPSDSRSKKKQQSHHLSPTTHKRKEPYC